MANQFTVEAPDFDNIKRETGVNTRDGIQTIWLALNSESESRRIGVREASERIAPKLIELSPAANQNNLNTQFASVIQFNGAASVDVTGFQARVVPTFLFLVVLGAGTITLKHQSASSIDRNRIVTLSSGDLAIATNRTVLLCYLNTRWREINFA